MNSKIKNPAQNFKNIQSAGFSATPVCTKLGQVEKSWSSLSLLNKGPNSDNQFMTTVGKNLSNPTKNVINKDYGNRRWNIIRGHWSWGVFGVKCNEISYSDNQSNTLSSLAPRKFRHPNSQRTIKIWYNRQQKTRMEPNCS